MYDNYAKLRDERGFTDYRVSQDTGIATSTLTEWKKGTYTPKLDKLLLIAKLFHVSIEELIGEEVIG